MARNENVNVIVRLKDKFSTGLKKLNRGIASLTSVAKKAAKSVAAIGVAAGATAAIFLRAAGKTEQWEIAFTTMLGSATEAKKLLKDLAQFAAKTPFELQGLTDNAKLLLGMGIEAKKLIPTMKALGDVAAGLGIDFRRLALNYGQVQAQGKLTGRELRDFAVAGVPLLSELAKNLGKTKAEIAAMTSRGLIGFKEVEAAFKSMSGEGGKFFNLMERQNKAFFGIISNIQDNLFQLSVAIGNKLLPRAKGLAAAIRDITDTSHLPEFNRKMDLFLLDLETRIKIFSAIATNLMAAPFRAETYTAIWDELQKAQDKLSDRILDSILSFGNRANKSMGGFAEKEVNRTELTSDKLTKIREDASKKRIKIEENYVKEVAKVKDASRKKEIEEDKLLTKHIKEINEETLNSMRDFGESSAKLFSGSFEDVIKVQMGSGGPISNAIQAGVSGMVPAMSSFLGGAVTGIMGGLLGNLFGARPVKTVAQYAQDAFNTMVKNTKRVLGTLSADKDLFQEQLGLLEDLKESMGADGQIPDRFKDFLNLQGENLTITEGMKQVLERLQQSNNKTNSLLDQRLEKVQRFNKAMAEGLSERGTIDSSTETGKIIIEAFKEAFPGAGERGEGISQTAALGIRDALLREEAELRKQGAGLTAGKLARLRESLRFERELEAFKNGGIVGNAPKFAMGGVVPGNSFSGDRVLIAANSGEMVLNRAQQSRLFETLSSGGGGGGQNVNITFAGPIMGDQQQAAEFAKRIDSELFKLKRNNQSVALN